MRALYQRKRYDTRTELRQAAEVVMEKHKVQGLLRSDFQVISHQRKAKGYRDRPTRRVAERELRLEVSIDEAAVEETLLREGWRVYATNAPVRQLPMSQAVLAYRDQYLVDRAAGA